MKLYGIVRFRFKDSKTFDTTKIYTGVYETRTAWLLNYQGTIEIIDIKEFDTRDEAKEWYIKEKGDRECLTTYL